MRLLVERLKDRKLDLTDGVKVSDERGWAEVITDSDEPVVHIYAEGVSPELSNELESEMRILVEEILGSDNETSEESSAGAD
jgi:mannose-1-phosphate guanylyltransferase/phosphomannomutase